MPCSSDLKFFVFLIIEGANISIFSLFSFSLQDSSQWPIVEPLPSYGQGTDLPGPRHRSLINGYNLTDVVITGNCFALSCIWIFKFCYVL